MATSKTQKSFIRQAQDKNQKLIAESPVSNVRASQIADKLKQPKVFIPLIVIVLVVLVFLFKGFLVAAIVNGQPITRIELISELEKRSGKQMLSNLVIQTLILQEAGKKGVTVSQKELDDAAKEVESSLSKQGQKLDQALALQGLTRKDFVQQIKIQKIIEKIFAKDTKVTDKEVADYIEKNKSTFPADMKQEDVKTGVFKQLEQQKLSTLVQPWIADIQKKAQIQYFVSF